MSCNTNRLDEIADVIDSLHKTPQYSENGYPMVRATDVKYGYLNLENTLRVQKSIFEEFSRRYIPNKDDIVITRVGSYGITSLVKDTNFCLGQNTSVIVPKINARYLYFALNSSYIKNQIENSVVGSTQKTLSLKAINSLEIPRFNEETEKKIAHILSTLDDKIELNRKMNQTLEEMASAIFKSWFVDFDPVHAKANCKAETELETIAKELGVSKEILDLFPSKFEESELGMIPKGWEATELSQICKIQSGYAFKSAWWQDTGVKVIKIKNIDGNRVNTLDCECVSEEIATKNSNSKLLNGDMLIAMTGATVGKVGVIYTSNEEYLLNQRVGRFQPIKHYDEYVKIFASSSKFFESIQGQAQGSAQPNISAREIESVKIVKPNEEIMKVFSLLLNPFFSKILEHQGEIQSLEKTRDTLLPKLLSGEIDVSALEIK
ncbi:restriction endonuclease subunit S [Aliarcobacter butzleri]|uniref:restriction endonuclease subunit S n=1 Tax=Aliarcobacter butzleri TaxID=28197 RepID=UPI003AF808B9